MGFRTAVEITATVIVMLSALVAVAATILGAPIVSTTTITSNVTETRNNTVTQTIPPQTTTVVQMTTTTATETTVNTTTVLSPAYLVINASCTCTALTSDSQGPLYHYRIGVANGTGSGLCCVIYKMNSSFSMKVIRNAAESTHWYVEWFVFGDFYNGTLTLTVTLDNGQVIFYQPPTTSKQISGNYSA